MIPWHNAPDFFNPDEAGNWYNTLMVGYVQLNPGSSQKQVEDKLIAFKNRHFLEERKSTSDIILLPLEGEHFRGSNGRKVLSILGVIALAILLISCINYINLAITQLAQRTKEMGVRKVMGGKPIQLVFQCMSENLIICFTAVLLGLIGAFILIPVVAEYFDYGISVENLESLGPVFFLLGIGFLVALLSSGWPSIMLSKETSVDLIRGALGWNKSGGWMRRGLMVIQFSISIFLVIGTLLIWKQIQYMQNKELNFNGNLVATTEYYPELFKSPKEIELRTATTKNELLKNPDIQAVTIANAVPGSYSENYNSFASLDSTSKKELSLRQVTVDADYFNTFEIPIKLGRNFSKSIESDESAVIINETAMKQFGWTSLDEKYLQAGGDGESHRVIGVVGDYYYQSLKHEIQPLIHFYSTEVAGVLAVKLHPDRVSDGLTALKEMWRSLDPYEAFEYTFVDESFGKLYEEQQRLGVTSTFFAVVAILLACLGLFSLAAYSIRLRKKEIGIRKVLGATTSDLVVILSKNYGILLLIGFLIACPVVYILLHQFLNDFAYRIPLSMGIFILGGGTVVLTSLLMVALQSRSAAIEDPLQVIREE